LQSVGRKPRWRSTTYADNRRTGAFILIDRFHQRHPPAPAWWRFALPPRHHTSIAKSHFVDKAGAGPGLNHQMPLRAVVHRLVGFRQVDHRQPWSRRPLHQRGIHNHDAWTATNNPPTGSNRDPSASPEGRPGWKNIRRVGEVAKLFVESGPGGAELLHLAVPRRTRTWCGNCLGPGEYVEIFVDVPLEECIRRDPQKASTPRLWRVGSRISPGIDSPYEAPQAPEPAALQGAEETSGSGGRAPSSEWFPRRTERAKL